MCQPRTWLLGLLVLSMGCDIFDKAKCDNPVAGPPPPRIHVSEAAEDAPSESFSGTARLAEVFPKRLPVGDSTSDVVTVAGQSPLDPILGNGRLVAMVNGSPVFADEILERYASDLAAAEKKHSPAEMERLRRRLVEKDLQGYIDQKLLGDAFRKSLTKEQRELLDQQLDTAFQEEELPRLLKLFGVSTELELERELRERNTSLESCRRIFNARQLAGWYVRSNMPPEREISRAELLAYYQEHIQEYDIPSRVKWQEIRVDHAKHGGRDGAIKVLEQAVAELQRGVEFAEVAKKYSDGATAQNGGNWDWTQKGSLVDTAVDQALFEIPVGEISAIIDSKDALVLVKVIDRQAAGRVPLADVQEKIETKLREAARKQAVQQIIDDARADAVIEIVDRELNQPASHER